MNRSGAVEQLRVHVRNLSMLDVNNGGAENNKGRVELYEKGYGKDAAGIAREAMAYGSYVFLDAFYPLLTLLLLQARTNDFDVVLIDTAGRMQDNEVSRRFCHAVPRCILLPKPKKPLMRALAKVRSKPIPLSCVSNFSLMALFISWFQPTIPTRSFSLARRL